MLLLSKSKRSHDIEGWYNTFVLKSTFISENAYLQIPFRKMKLYCWKLAMCGQQHILGLLQYQMNLDDDVFEQNTNHKGD